MEARNARLVFVPRERFAVNVSAPPKTLRTRADALYITLHESLDDGLRESEKLTAVPSLFPSSVELLT